MDKNKIIKTIAKGITRLGETKPNQEFLFLSEKDLNNQEMIAADCELGGNVSYELKWVDFPNTVEVTINNNENLGASMYTVRTEKHIVNLKD